MKVRMIWVGRTVRGTWLMGWPIMWRGSNGPWSSRNWWSPRLGQGAPTYQQKLEGERLLSALKPGEKVVVLDERGMTMGSPEFAGLLGRWQDQGVRQVAFVVGGAYGLSDAVRQRADLVLSLSSMTFPHQLVRITLTEQVYRAFSILGGSGYHH
ncbi:MAG: 23S rRNA (pseudouridine(1915)-N(3))-methyltransferase RlmH [Flavobacteriales bacterium]|nr:23S rRNA (pseudouridine(1915)-N(3))-methyltransferase RlmH [Flavobacteriales bacterium]